MSFNSKRKFIVKFHTVSINKNGSNWQSNIHIVAKSGQKLTFFLRKKRHQAAKMTFLILKTVLNYSSNIIKYKC